MRRVAMPIISGLLAAGLLAVAPAAADAVKLKAELKGSNSVPPNSSAGTGSVEASFDTATRLLTYTVTYSGLSGPLVAAHFHGPAAHGKNAGIVVPINAAGSPIKGRVTLNDSQAAELMAGKWYVNLHTAANPGGEIRGQVTK
ncbi:MAG TPA: CHRD domain-containing protein [Xanthobacteraceae bacterium]|nr:CHRD domain-containing protein [Xanthobacteraceae bacterium]